MKYTLTLEFEESGDELDRGMVMHNMSCILALHQWLELDIPNSQELYNIINGLIELNHEWMDNLDKKDLMHLLYMINWTAECINEIVKEKEAN